MKQMKTGDLVTYTNDCYPIDPNMVGIIVGVCSVKELSHCQYKVRWSDHTPSTRDWYADTELITLIKK